ncbi:hypothetical protein RI367_008417 [Sorochytrium milnesiophthora]
MNALWLLVVLAQLGCRLTSRTFRLQPATEGSSLQLPLAGERGGDGKLWQWMDDQFYVSLFRLTANFEPHGTSLGCVVAAQSRHTPNYWYYWVRDGALIADLGAKAYSQACAFTSSALLEEALWRFVDFNLPIQTVKTRSASESDPIGIGEPKYEVNGSAFNGPALRALALTRFARAYIACGGSQERVRDKIYRAELPAHTVVKRDLEMVTRNFDKPSFDLWEEVQGQHFYTVMVQHQALVEGSQLARLMNDSQAADYYEVQAEEVAGLVKQHAARCTGPNPHIITTLHRTAGIDYKTEELDVAVILAVLHTRNSTLYDVSHECVLATAHALKTRFAKLYPINSQDNSGNTAPGIGRYPEDRYYGGNPWFLCTLAFAELYYRLLGHARQHNSMTVTTTSLAFYRSLLKDESLETGVYNSTNARWDRILHALQAEGDQYIRRVRAHTGVNGAMDEQFDKDNGAMLSAADLTWSYAAFLSMVNTRDNVV